MEMNHTECTYALESAYGYHFYVVSQSHAHEYPQAQVKFGLLSLITMRPAANKTLSADTGVAGTQR